LQERELRRSLAQTIVWCADQQLTAVGEETDEVKKRRRMAEEAVRLMQEAHAEKGGSWKRLHDDDKWQRGQKMLEVADVGPIAPLSQQLRTADLRPSCSLAELRKESERDKLVASVVGRRSSLLRNHDRQAQSTQLADLGSGRLLIYVPEENLADGAAKYASRGFFDVDNVPPWDLWVVFAGGTLLSWVPPELIQLAQSGIDVNPEGCIAWLK
jgi:hypothetical protein